MTMNEETSKSFLVDEKFRFDSVFDSKMSAKRFSLYLTKIHFVNILRFWVMLFTCNGNSADKQKPLTKSVSGKHTLD